MSTDQHRLAVYCPHCSALLDVRAQYAGSSISCPACRGVVAIAGGYQPPPLPAAPEDPLAFLAVQRRALEPSPRSGKLHAVTERTAKRYKLMQLIGAMMTIIGFALFASGMFGDVYGPRYASDSHVLKIVSGMLLGVLGLVEFFIGRFLAWWNHG